MPPLSLSRNVSPPPRRRRSAATDGPSVVRSSDLKHVKPRSHLAKSNTASAAAIEAGEAEIQDHLDYFAEHFRHVCRQGEKCKLSITDFRALYLRNQHPRGRHFVVHQHDHPVSGVHYDLRLQFSESSTLSFAIPYGLPGNPNSVRPIRMAVETRVHTLWNNLVESASHATGSLLIWDTGEFDIIPWKEMKSHSTEDEQSMDETLNALEGQKSQSERLRSSFTRRRIRIRLHGVKLPPNYTISMWLKSSNDRDKQPKKPRRKRRRLDPAKIANSEAVTTDDEQSGQDSEAQVRTIDGETGAEDEETAAAVASEDEEDATIRANNAYPGASNTIGSVHQRYWFLTLDKKNSGFERARRGAGEGKWTGGFDPFFVCGRDAERSIVTGRNADEVMEDAGVNKFVGRKMWRPILE